MLIQTSVETAKRGDPAIPLPPHQVLSTRCCRSACRPRQLPCDIAQLTIEFGMRYGSDERPDGQVGDAQPSQRQRL